MSNRDSAGGAERGDPVETVLYAVFVATSARASVAELGDMLQVRWQVLNFGSGDQRCFHSRPVLACFGQQKAHPQTRLNGSQQKGFVS